MKWLALILVVLNAAFFGWRFEMQLRATRNAERPAVPLPMGAPSLTLVSELDQLPPMIEEAKLEPAFAEAAGAAPAPESPSVLPAPYEEKTPSFAHEVYVPSAQVVARDTTAPTEQAPAASSSTPPAAAPAIVAEDLSATALDPDAPKIEARAARGGAALDQCVQIGPFPAPRDADAMETWLSPRASTLYRVLEVVGKKRFYWVYLEPESPDEARAKVAELEHKGVKDYLLIKREGIKNAISLGLFSSQDSVNRRLTEMNQQGYRPIVVPRIEVKDREWLRAKLAAGATDSNQVPTELLAGGTVQPIACAQIAEFTPSP